LPLRCCANAGGTLLISDAAASAMIVFEKVMVTPGRDDTSPTSTWQIVDQRQLADLLMNFS
jgi:hypothetical protein